MSKLPIHTPLRVAIAVAGLSATLLIVGPAEARITKISVGVSGTQTAHVHVTDSGCSAQPGVVATGDMSESFSLRTYRRQILTVLQGFRSSLGFDGEFTRSNREILTRGTITRSSTLSADGQAMLGGCEGQPPASCGTRSFSRLGLAAGPGNSSRGRFLGVVINNAVTQPRGPFDACGGPVLLFPNLASRPSFRAPIPRSFLTSCRHGSMTRSLDGTIPQSVSGTTASTGATTVHLRVTVTDLGCLRGLA